MTISRHRLAGVVAALTLAARWIGAQGPANDFRPDSTFTGSTLAGWRPLGASRWKAENGELTGIASAPGGGWLVLDASYQDLNFFARFRCAGECRTGVLFRAEKTPDGTTGVYVSLDAGELSVFRVTLDASGREVARQALARRRSVRALRAGCLGRRARRCPRARRRSCPRRRGYRRSGDEPPRASRSR